MKVKYNENNFERSCLKCQSLVQNLILEIVVEVGSPPPSRPSSPVPPTSEEEPDEEEPEEDFDSSPSDGEAATESVELDQSMEAGSSREDSVSSSGDTTDTHSCGQAGVGSARRKTGVPQRLYLDDVRASMGRGLAPVPFSGYVTNKIPCRPIFPSSPWHPRGLSYGRGERRPKGAGYKHSGASWYSSRGREVPARLRAPVEPGLFRAPPPPPPLATLPCTTATGAVGELTGRSRPRPQPLDLSCLPPPVPCLAPPTPAPLLNGRELLNRYPNTAWSSPTGSPSTSRVIGPFRLVSVITDTMSGGAATVTDSVATSGAETGVTVSSAVSNMATMVPLSVPGPSGVALVDPPPGPSFIGVDVSSVVQHGTAGPSGVSFSNPGPSHDRDGDDSGSPSSMLEQGNVLLGGGARFAYLYNPRRSPINILNGLFYCSDLGQMVSMCKHSVNSQIEINFNILESDDDRGAAIDYCCFQINHLNMYCALGRATREQYRSCLSQLDEFLHLPALSRALAEFRERSGGHTPTSKARSQTLDAMMGRATFVPTGAYKKFLERPQSLLNMEIEVKRCGQCIQGGE